MAKNEDTEPLDDNNIMWLTREKTKLEEKSDNRKEMLERPAYLQLDLLNRGDVFVSCLPCLYSLIK